MRETTFSHTDTLPKCQKSNSVDPKRCIQDDHTDATTNNNDTHITTHEKKSVRRSEFPEEYRFTTGRDGFQFITITGYVACIVGSTIVVDSQLLRQPSKALLSPPKYHTALSYRGFCGDWPPKIDNFSVYLRNVEVAANEEGWVECTCILREVISLIFSNSTRIGLAAGSRSFLTPWHNADALHLVSTPVNTVIGSRSYLIPHEESAFYPVGAYPRCVGWG